MTPEADIPKVSPRQNYYPETLWTQIFRTRGDATDSEDAWRVLVERYRHPIELQLQKRFKDDQDIANLVAEFIGKVFVHKLIPAADREKGRFRCLLASALHGFTHSVLRKIYAQKHGRRETHIPLDSLEFEQSSALVSGDANPTEFGADLDRSLACEAFHRAFAAARRQALARGTAEEFDLLMGKQQGGHRPDQEIAERLGLSTAAVKTRRHRLRTYLREAFRREVADLVAPEQVDEETKYLMSLLYSGPSDFMKNS